MAVDHDDGSRYYHDDFNLFLFGGYENFMGKHKVSQNNLYVYPEYQSPLDGGDGLFLARRLLANRVLPRRRRPIDQASNDEPNVGRLYKQPFCAISQGTDATQFSGNNESWSNNTCITTSGSPYQFECGGVATRPATHDNRFLVPAGTNLTFTCGSYKNIPLAEWQKIPNWDGTAADARTIIGAIPSDADLISMAKEVLGFGLHAHLRPLPVGVDDQFV